MNDNMKPMKIEGKYESKIDVAVLILFFNRPNTLKQVFEQVKIARPSKLFLYQDGARENNEKDLENVAKCREVVEEIDWDCEVYKYYQTENQGCDPSEYISQKWAFSIVDKCIVLEDDDVPTQSFFPYCKELLEKYENDERINIICGMNNLGEYEDVDADYFFAYTGSICGWASWRRVIDQWTDKYHMLSDERMVKKFKSANENKHLMNNFIKICRAHEKSGKAHYESIMSYNMYTQNTINVVPKYNMIRNIGNNSEGGTHSASNVMIIPKGVRKIFTIKSYEIEFPLKHPTFVMEEVGFKKKLFRVMGWGHPFVRFYRAIESVFLMIRYNDKGALKRKLKKYLGFSKSKSTGNGC